MVMVPLSNQASEILCQRGKPHQPRILFPAKLFFISEGEIKIFTDKQKLMGFVASTPAW